MAKARTLKLKLTPSRRGVLSSITERGRSINEIAGLVSTSPSYVSRVVSEFVKFGLVSMRDGNPDRRFKIASITRAGAARTLR
jgi:DNA-binding MarR family transcriptional regulator